jgi:hypothetical protein
VQQTHLRRHKIELIIRDFIQNFRRSQKETIAIPLHTSNNISEFEDTYRYTGFMGNQGNYCGRPSMAFAGRPWPRRSVRAKFESRTVFGPMRQIDRILAGSRHSGIRKQTRAEKSVWMHLLRHAAPSRFKTSSTRSWRLQGLQRMGLTLTRQAYLLRVRKRCPCSLSRQRICPIIAIKL